MPIANEYLWYLHSFFFFPNLNRVPIHIHICSAAHNQRQRYDLKAMRSDKVNDDSFFFFHFLHAEQKSLFMYRDFDN